jgi:glucokinase
VTTPHAIGIDIGGTKIAVGLIDRDGLLGELEVIPTDADGGGSMVLQRALALGRSILERNPPASQPSAIGIAAGGWIDTASGRVVGATALLPGWAGIDLRAAFEHELGIRTTAVNDVQAMGVAEARLGAGRDRRICLCAAVGTGIGGAIIIDGRVFGGAGGFAGAIGHIASSRSGPRCSCGQRGCIEAEASGPAIARAFDACRQRGAGRGAREAAGSALPEVVRAIESPDRAARECALDVTATAGTRLGRVLGGLANALDPDVIIVGGGATAALGEHFLAAIRSGVAEAALDMIKPVVIPSQLGASASVVGAGLLALDGVNGSTAVGPDVVG